MRTYTRVSTDGPNEYTTPREGFAAEHALVEGGGGRPLILINGELARVTAWTGGAVYITRDGDFLDDARTRDALAAYYSAHGCDPSAQAGIITSIPRFRTFDFAVTLRGEGFTMLAAWHDAVAAFTVDPGDWDSKAVEVEVE